MTSLRKDYMTRDELNSILTDLGIEPTKAMVTALLTRFNEEKRNAIAETTEKMLDDIKDWMSPENYQKLQSDYDALKKENDSLKSNDYSDYEELKKFKADTIAKAEADKKNNFLKAQGCKHPDLIAGKLDFSKATWDEDKKTYTGLDEDIKSLKGSYADLFEAKGTQQITPDNNPKSTDSDFMARYKAEHPELNIR